MANDHGLLFITETWLNDGVFDSEVVDAEQYSIFQRDPISTLRVKRDGGGVFIAIKNDLKPSLVQEFQSGALTTLTNR